jgi:hypothetical protein
MVVNPGGFAGKESHRSKPGYILCICYQVITNPLCTCPRLRLGIFLTFYIYVPGGASLPLTFAIQALAPHPCIKWAANGSSSSMSLNAPSKEIVFPSINIRFVMGFKSSRYNIGFLN